MTDPLIARLSDERDALVERVSAIDHAIEALTGTKPNNGPAITRRGGSVGSDKKAEILALIEDNDEIRQAAIAGMLELNSGSVSMATRDLEREGLIEEITGRKRDKVWRIATKKKR